MSSGTSKAVIVGSTGFLGSALKKLLDPQKHEVVLCNRRSISEMSSPQFPVSQLESIRADEIETVYLLAAYIPYGQPDEFTQPLIAANVELVAKVCDHFRHSRIVYSSSVSVYGTPIQPELSENAPLNQPGAYGLSKLAGETIVRAHERHCVLRFSSLYGAGMTAPTFLPVVVNKALADGAIAVYGSGTRMQNYLHVADAANMLLAAAKTDVNDVFNAVDMRSYSNTEVAHMVAAAVGDVTIAYTGEDASPSYIYDNTKWNHTFAYRPQVTLKQGIEELVESCRTNNA